MVILWKCTVVTLDYLCLSRQTCQSRIAEVQVCFD